jgi:hypothetical protein
MLVGYQYHHSQDQQAHTGEGIHEYPILETPIHPVRNLQDLVGNFSDTFIRKKRGAGKLSNFAVAQPNF